MIRVPCWDNSSAYLLLIPPLTSSPASPSLSISSTPLSPPSLLLSLLSSTVSLPSLPPLSPDRGEPLTRGQHQRTAPMNVKQTHKRCAHSLECACAYGHVCVHVHAHASACASACARASAHTSAQPITSHDLATPFAFDSFLCPLFRRLVPPPPLPLPPSLSTPSHDASRLSSKQHAPPLKRQSVSGSNFRNSAVLHLGDSSPPPPR